MRDMELFFLTLLKCKTDVVDAYFELPTNDSFTYCIKEFYHCQENVINNNTQNNYLSDLANHFYNFLENDKILQKINSLDYAILLDDLRIIGEGKKTITKERITFYREVCHRNSYLYLKEICKQLVSLYNENSTKYDLIEELANLYLNEILSRGIDPRFIFESIKLYENNYFNSFEDYINYFLHQNYDSYDIYIPIVNMHKNDSEYFDQKEQEICFDDETNTSYAKVYRNKCIDYFSLINDQMTRIDSIFNLLKLYTKTKIDFDFDKNIIVKMSNIFGSKIICVDFKGFISYKGISPYLKHLSLVIENLDSLSTKDKNNYHKLLNIIAYAEKDNDIISPSSYVDYWIALESLFGLSGRGYGYGCVSKYLPSIVAPKITINKITYFLSKLNIQTKAEEFITKVCNNNVDDILKSKNPYYLYVLKKLSINFGSFKNIRKYYNDLEQEIKIDILRIYMLRNEYVHESNLKAFSSMQPYKLKNYLTIVIDEFFKGMAQKIDSRYISDYGIVYDIFSRIINKNDRRQYLLQYLCEKRKTKNIKKELDIIEAESKLNKNDIILNILLNNNELLKKYVTQKEYRHKRSKD